MAPALANYQPEINPHSTTTEIEKSHLTLINFCEVSVGYLCKYHVETPSPLKYFIVRDNLCVFFELPVKLTIL